MFYLFGIAGLVVLYVGVSALLGRLNASGHEWTVTVGKYTLTTPLARWFAYYFMVEDLKKQL